MQGYHISIPRFVKRTLQNKRCLTSLLVEPPSDMTEIICNLLGYCHHFCTCCCHDYLYHDNCSGHQPQSVTLVNTDMTTQVSLLGQLMAVVISLTFLLISISVQGGFSSSHQEYIFGTPKNFLQPLSFFLANFSISQVMFLTSQSL